MRRLGRGGLGTCRQLLDLPLRAVEPVATEPVQLLAALPERDRFVQRCVAALEPLDNRFELTLGGLEGWLRSRQRVSSTVAENAPSPSSTSTASPRSSTLDVRTIPSLVRTIA
jgi:hypothetical protein